jgi:hypothetical protein
VTSRLGTEKTETFSYSVYGAGHHSHSSKEVDEINSRVWMRCKRVLVDRLTAIATVAIPRVQS